jgi:hypothetical protein
LSDTTLNAFVASGTAAERVAFVPDPPVPIVGPDPGYFFFETDTSAVYAWDGAVWVLVANGGTGDVVGPASSVDDRIATFDGITGKLLQDGGQTIGDVIAAAVFACGDVDGPAASVDGEIALYDLTSGKLLKRATGTGIVRVTSGVYGTAGPVNLTSEVTGDLPLSNLAQASAASRLLGRGSASGAGDYQEITLGSGLTMTSQVLSASGSSSGDVVGPASATDDRIATFDGATGKLIQDGGQTIAQVIASATAASGIKTPGVTVDNGATVVTVGDKGTIQCPISGTITKWTLLAKPAGDVEFDVFLDAFGSYPPTTSIVASAPPLLSGADSATDSTLTGWTTAVTAGDVFGFEIVGTPATITRVTLQIEVTP